MPKKEVIKSLKGSEEKKRAETSTVKGTITSEQRKILQNFIGIIGSNEQDVVGKINFYFNGKTLRKTQMDQNLAS